MDEREFSLGRRDVLLEVIDLLEGAEFVDTKAAENFGRDGALIGLQLLVKIRNQGREVVASLLEGDAGFPNAKHVQVLTVIRAAREPGVDIPVDKEVVEDPNPAEPASIDSPPAVIHRRCAECSVWPRRPADEIQQICVRHVPGARWFGG